MKLFLWDQRRARVESRWLLQRAILQYEAAKQNKQNDGESDADSLIVICETPQGKPFALMRDGSALPVQISVTHTGDWWLCAVGESQVGLDAELRSRHIKPSLARRICTEQELRWLEEGGDDADLFRRRLLWLWVRKEAYVKYLGTGISQGLKTVSAVECGSERNGFAAVDLSSVSKEAQEQLEVAVYSPQERKIEGIEWLIWN